MDLLTIDYTHLAFERARGHPMERYISSLCSAPVELCNDTRATAPPADPTDDMWYTLMGAEQLIFDSSASQKVSRRKQVGTSSNMLLLD
jgi:hypothetical protein